MAPIERDQVFRARMSTEEVEMLQALADKAGVTASDVVRQLIRREYAEQFKRKLPTKKHTK